MVSMNCRSCDANLKRFLELGDIPPVNAFLAESEIPDEKKYPLNLSYCPNCLLVQLETIVPPEGVPNPSNALLGTQNIIQVAITLILIIASIAALAVIIFGGIRWIVSGGDKEKLQGARNMITYALVGLVVIFLSYFIINTIGDFFGVKLLGR